jgi:hypothetical protein
VDKAPITDAEKYWICDTIAAIDEDEIAETTAVVIAEI